MLGQCSAGECSGGAGEYKGDAGECSSGAGACSGGAVSAVVDWHVLCDLPEDGTQRLAGFPSVGYVKPARMLLEGRKSGDERRDPH